MWQRRLNSWHTNFLRKPLKKIPLLIMTFTVMLQTLQNSSAQLLR
nr:MAG TPA: hypothetical protein [Caudoviricetes sp.]DAU10165.1 MAG TPA: hypothetical protein [Caudoviricetes sp.]